MGSHFLSVILFIGRGDLCLQVLLIQLASHCDVFITVRIDGSTDRCCIAIVTNKRALLSGSDQPVQNLGRHRILCMKGG